MAIAFVKGPPTTASHAGGTGATYTTSWVHAGAGAGHQLVIPIYWDTPETAIISSVTVTGATDGQVSASLLTKHARTGDNAMQLAYLSNITTTEDKTIEITFNTQNLFASASSWEYSGGDTTGFYDSAQAGTDTDGSATTPAAATLSTNTDHALIFAFVYAHGDDAGWTTPSGYTIRAHPNVGFFQQGYDNVDVTPAGSKTVSVALGDVDWWCMVAAAFKPAGGAGTTPITVSNLTDSLSGGEIV